MSDDPIIPTPDDILAPGIDKLVSLRPAALKHINSGEGAYSHIIAGVRAQAAVQIQRLLSGVRDHRLPTATAQSLLEFIDSEFEVSIPTPATTAVGEVTIARVGGTLAAGNIRKGTKFSREANAVGDPLPVQQAQYESIEDVHVPKNALSALIKIKASKTGEFANHVEHGQPSGLSITTTLFDPLFQCSTSSALFSAAGGSDGVSDAVARRIAKAYSVGQYGPTDDALLVGALLSGGRYVAVADDPATGIANVYVADASWSSSPEWCATIAQGISDNEYLGFGCRTSVLPVTNLFIHCDVTVTLRDQRFMNDTAPVRAAIQAALRSYFDDRPDWYTWTIAGIKAAVSRAHSRILTCTTVSVKDAVSELVVATPATSINVNQPVLHYYLVDNSVDITFVSPT